MATIKVKTTLPCLIVEVWNGHNQSIGTYRGNASAIPHFKSFGDNTGLGNKENIIDIPDLEKGIYTIRFSLPYFNEGGTEFPMPVMMDELVSLQTNETEYYLTF
jgi:hypothetical protein